tara:strand:- start:199 stop:1140 length:942 start_codon:yes stop_codon:yes gene_type:complete
MLFVNAGADTVHIGASTGSSVLNVDSTGRGGSVIGLNLVNTDSGSDTNTFFNLTNNIDQDLQFKLSEVNASTKSVYIGPSTNTQMNLTGASVASLNRDLYLDSASLVVNQDSRDYDFRVESDGQASMLVVNAGQNCVIIGDTSGGTGFYSVPKLHIDAQDTTNGIVVERARQDYTCYAAAMQDNTGTCYYAFMVNGSDSKIGSIDMTSTGVSYVTTSDYRVKENVTALTGATERLQQLNPSRFNFIADADTTVDGFLAHEVQTVVPEAVTGTHNEVDAEGNPVYQGIDQAKLVPLLVATIKELEARITALENS